MRNFLVLTFCILLGGCGFAPVYGINRDTPTSAESKLAQVNIGNIADENGLRLRNELIDRFYPHQRPDNSIWDLNVSNFREKVTNLDITSTDEATRGELRLDIHIALVDRSTQRKLMERDLRTITAYNILDSEFATRVTEQNARENAIQDLAQQIEMQLDLYFKRGDDPAGIAPKQ